MEACPTCSREFTTQRGVRVHHALVHGERLPNRTCAECGNEFHCEHAKKYCSEECLANAAPFAGEANPNYKGGKERTECELCGQSFEYYPSEKEGRFCSTCVEVKQWQEPPKISGADNPRWKGGKISQLCEICGNSVERWPSEFSEVVLCGEKCRGTWLSETFTGEGHPNWEGGDPGPYGKGWANVRREALERDGYTCLVCGATKEELGRNPDVHHIVPVRTFVDDPARSIEDAHRLENVISLCLPCHRKADAGKISATELASFIRA